MCGSSRLAPTRWHYDESLKPALFAFDAIEFFNGDFLVIKQRIGIVTGSPLDCLFVLDRQGSVEVLHVQRCTDEGTLAE